MHKYTLFFFVDKLGFWKTKKNLVETANIYVEKIEFCKELTFDCL